MLAGEAAAAAGATVKALRYYETVGLIEPARRENGYRDYSARDIQLAAEIRALMSLGLAPKETQPFLDCLRDGHEAGDDCPESLAAYQHQIERLNVIIARLTHSRDELTRQLRHAARRGFRFRDDEEETSEMLPQPDPLPDDLPAPQDDGAARHLPGRTLPPLAFETTDGDRVQLDAVSTGRWVLYLYPLTGDPAADLPEGWNQIPGARGCSWEACGFRDNLAELQAHGAQRVLALSTDRAEYQQDLLRRLHLPYPMLSDPELSLARALDLPTFRADGMALYKRLSLIVDGDHIAHVFYPIFPPGSHADEVLDWLRENPAPSTGTRPS